MTAPTPEPTCRSKACAGHTCPRSDHVYAPAPVRGAYHRHGRCTTHRACQEFELDELAALEPAPEQPVYDVWGADFGVVAASRAQEPEPAKRDAFEVAREALLARYGTVDPVVLAERGADAVEIGAAEQIVKRDAHAALGEPAPSATSPVDGAGTLLATWNAWHCDTCGSRWFEPSRCCGITPTPVQMQMHRRIP